MIVGYVMNVIGKDNRMKPDYDEEKFDMDEYGNLVPKNSEWFRECIDKLGDTTNVKLVKGNDAKDI